jgi:hypothetical protein
MHIFGSKYFAWAFDDPHDLSRFRQRSFINAYLKLYSENRETAVSLMEKFVNSTPSYRTNEYQGTDGRHNITRHHCVTFILRPLTDACKDEGFMLPWVMYQNEVSYRDESISTDRLRLWHGFCNEPNVCDGDDAVEYMQNAIGMFTCEDCGHPTAEDDCPSVGDYTSICTSCCDISYTWSDYEDRYIHNDDVCTALDQYGNGVSISSSNTGDFTYDEDREMYVHDEYEPPLIRDYHSSKSSISYKPDEWTARYDRYLGVELEVECVETSRTSQAQMIKDYVENSGHRLFFERDGSLQSGFEMITDPMSLPAHRDLFSFLKERPITRGMRSHNTTTCGLHVHVSRSGLTDLQIQKVVAFVNSPDNEWFIRALARRYSSGFCVVKSDKKIGKSIHIGLDRYEAVNLTNRRTIEFRIFRGSLKYEAVIAAIEFCHAILEFCKPANTGINQLSAGAFLTFCSKQLAADTKTLRAYVSQRISGRAEVTEEEAA